MAKQCSRSNYHLTIPLPRACFAGNWWKRCSSMLVTNGISGIPKPVISSSPTPPTYALRCRPQMLIAFAHTVGSMAKIIPHTIYKELIARMAETIYPIHIPMSMADRAELGRVFDTLSKYYTPKHPHGLAFDLPHTEKDWSVLRGKLRRVITGDCEIITPYENGGVCGHGEVYFEHHTDWVVARLTYDFLRPLSVRASTPLVQLG